MGYPISLEGKVALVVGGAGGIGAATSKMLAQAGARIAVTHLDRPELANQAAGLIEPSPVPAIPLSPPMSPTHRR